MIPDDYECEGQLSIEDVYNVGWIPCGDRLPLEGQKVLACINPSVAEHEIILEHYHKDYKFWFDGTVIAWMPLPEPYQQKGV